MNQTQISFLHILKHALHTDSPFWNSKVKNWDAEITSEDWESIFLLAHQQNVLPLIYNVVYSMAVKKEELQPLFSAVKQQSMRLTIQQIQKTTEFLKLYKHLVDNGITPVITKGIICRNLYPNPDARLSNDEDLWILKEQAMECRDILLEYGMHLLKDEDVETCRDVPYGKNGSPIYIEVHTALFEPKSSAYGDWNDFFADSRKNCTYVNVDGQEICTLSVTDHFFYLICHAFKHFLHSGCGIRQICDILMTAEAYVSEIDWKKIEIQSKAINADMFLEAAFVIGRKFLGFDFYNEACPDFLRNAEVDELPLLEDLLDAGVYGSSTSERQHTSNMTLQAVAADKQGTRVKNGIFASAFPSADELSGRYPYLKEKKYLLPVAWVDRVWNYRKETAGNKNSTAESIRLGEQRIDLLRRYGIIERTEK